VESDNDTECLIDPIDEKIFLVAMLIWPETTFLGGSGTSGSSFFISYRCVALSSSSEGFSGGSAGHPGRGQGVGSLAWDR
jgi:hypothetical protein